MQIEHENFHEITIQILSKYDFQNTDNIEKLIEEYLEMYSNTMNTLKEKYPNAGGHEVAIY